LGAIAAGLRLGPFLHAARLDRWTALEALQPSNLIALRCHDPLQLSQLAQQFQDLSFELGTGQTGRISGRGHALNESYSPASGEAPKCLLPGILLLYV
jgi:hypothetical protein